MFSAGTVPTSQQEEDPLTKVLLHSSLQYQWDMHPRLVTDEGQQGYPAQHWQQELFLLCTPSTRVCKRERGADSRPQCAHLPYHKTPARERLVAPKKQRVSEETRLLYSTATSAGPSTTGEGFHPQKHRWEVHQRGKKSTNQGRKKQFKHTHTHT